MGVPLIPMMVVWYPILSFKPYAMIQLLFLEMDLSPGPFAMWMI